MSARETMEEALVEEEQSQELKSKETRIAGAKAEANTAYEAVLTTSNPSHGAWEDWKDKKEHTRAFSKRNPTLVKAREQSSRRWMLALLGITFIAGVDLVILSTVLGSIINDVIGPPLSYLLQLITVFGFIVIEVCCGEFMRDENGKLHFVARAWPPVLGILSMTGYWLDKVFEFSDLADPSIFIIGVCLGLAATLMHSLPVAKSKAILQGWSLIKHARLLRRENKAENKLYKAITPLYISVINLFEIRDKHGIEIRELPGRIKNMLNWYEGDQFTLAMAASKDGSSEELANVEVEITPALNEANKL